MTANSPSAWSERAKIANAHEAVLWSASGQQERFTSIIAALHPARGDTLLDYGCGTGALRDALPGKIKYIGYDWAPGMVERARRDHPNTDFADVMPLRHFDLIACVGTFNLQDNWSKALTWKTLRLLWRMTDRALAACLYAGDDPDCIHYTEQELNAIEFPDNPVRYVKRHRPNDLLFALYRR